MNKNTWSFGLIRKCAILMLIVLSFFMAMLPSISYAGDKRGSQSKRYAKRGEGVLISGNKSSFISKRNGKNIYEVSDPSHPVNSDKTKKSGG